VTPDKKSLYKDFRIKISCFISLYHGFHPAVCSALDNAGLMRQSGQGGSTAHAAPNVFCPFQKHWLLTRRSAQFILSNGIKWNFKIF
jgi:hypothetical protein